MLLDAVGASSRVRNQMGGSRFTALYLYKAFGTNWMVAAAGMVNVWGIVLRDMT